MRSLIQSGFNLAKKKIIRYFLGTTTNAENFKKVKVILHLVFRSVADREVGDDDGQVDHNEEESQEPEP